MLHTALAPGSHHQHAPHTLAFSVRCDTTVGSEGWLTAAVVRNGGPPQSVCRHGAGQIDCRHAQPSHACPTVCFCATSDPIAGPHARLEQAEDVVGCDWYAVAIIQLQ